MSRGSNSLNPEEPSPSSINVPNLVMKQSEGKFDKQYQKSIKDTIPVFEKLHEHRTNSDFTILKRFIKKSSFFKQVQKNCSLDFVKNMSRFSKVIKCKEKQFIFRQNNIMQNYFIGLTGNYVICHFSKPEQDENIELLSEGEKQQASFYEQFKKFSSRHLKFLKKNIHQTPALITKQTESRPQLEELHISQRISITSEMDKVFFAKNHFRQPNMFKRHICSLVALSDSYVLQIDFKKVNELFRQEYTKNILKIMDQFLHFQCFTMMKKQKLKQMVEESQPKTYTKNSVLFRQGEKDDRIFLLVKGQVKLEKTVSVGNENPNKLYRSRFYINKHRANRSVRVPDVEYADFSKVFNVQISKKSVHLSTITALSIFGEEQIISQTNRQAKAIVCSRQCEVYEMTLGSISSYFTKDGYFQAIDFLKTLEQQITNKKILYRQENLGCHVSLLNKGAKSGFYIQKGIKEEKQIKKQIAKMNKTISIASSTPHRTFNSNHEKQSSQLHTGNLASSRSRKLQTQRPDTEVKYNSFEIFFNDEKQHKKQELNKRLSSRAQANLKSHSETNIAVQHSTAAEGQIPSPVRFNPEQRGILDLLHGNQRTLLTNRTSKSRQQSHRNKKRQADVTIDITKPLFSTQYIIQQHKEEMRIQNRGRLAKIQRVLGAASRPVSGVRTMNNSRVFESLCSREGPSKMPKRSQSFRL